MNMAPFKALDRRREVHKIQCHPKSKMPLLSRVFMSKQGSFDKSAHGYEDGQSEGVGTNYEKTRPSVPVKNAANLRARFESMATQGADEAK